MNFEGYGKLENRPKTEINSASLREEKGTAFKVLPETTPIGSYCPNCGARLEGQKCKLFCRTPGCGYLVTCSEW